MRALRIELRRSVAIGAVVLLCLLGFAQFLWGTPGGWTSMTFTQREGALVTWPLAVGVGAWQARRERMAGLKELFATSPRSSAQRLAPVAVALALAAVIAYLLVLLVGTAQVGRSPADLYFTLEGAAVAVVGAISLVAAAWLGLWIGRLLPSAFTAPVVTVIAVAGIVLLTELEVMSNTGPALSMLLPVLEVPYQQDHVQLPLELSGYQGLWLAALAISAFALTTASSWLRRALALVPAVVAAAILIPALPMASASQAYVVNQQALTPVCTSDLPKVCVIRAHSGLLDEVTGPTRKALAALSVLPDAPTWAMEEPAEPIPLYRPGSPELEKMSTAVPRPRDRDVLALSYETGRDGHVDDPADLTAYLLQDALNPGNCEQDRQASQFDRYHYGAKELAGAWLIEQAGVEQLDSPDQALFAPSWKAFSALPADVQKKRIIAYRDGARACLPGQELHDLLLKGNAGRETS